MSWFPFGMSWFPFGMSWFPFGMSWFPFGMSWFGLFVGKCVVGEVGWIWRRGGK